MDAPQIASPPEDRDRAGHLASRVTPDRLIPAQAILVGASPDRTLSNRRGGRGGARLAERPRPGRPRRNWPGPDARAVPLAGRHAAVPVAGARPLGSAQRPAEPSHCAGAVLRCWRADRRAAWLHQEDAEDATG